MNEEPQDDITRPLDEIVSPLYGLVMMMQEKTITDICFWKCGKVLFAGADGGEGIGPLFLCRSGKCAYLDKQMDEPLGDIDGDPLYLRKLKED